MTQTYHVTAWRPETYSTSGEFEADSPAQALAQAKAAFEGDGGECCVSLSDWEGSV